MVVIVGFDGVDGDGCCGRCGGGGGVVGGGRAGAGTLFVQLSSPNNTLREGYKKRK